MIKRILAAMALCAVSLVSKSSFAWFQVCNHRASGAWVSYSHYLSNTSVAYSECSHSGLSGGCYYSSWKTEGWWRVEGNQCATVLGGAITNQYSYVRADYDDGAYVGGGVGFYVRDAAFSWDEYTQSYNTGGECIGSQSVYDPCTPQGYWEDFYEVDTAGYSNFTLNVN